MESLEETSDPANAASPSRRAISVAGLLLAAYALPLFFPPAAQPPVLPEPTASWTARVFPGVPGLWVVARLVALVLGAGLVAWALPGRAWLPPERGSNPRYPRPVSIAAAWGLGLAVAGLAAAAPALGRPLQVLYFVLLLAPAAVLALGARKSAPRGPAFVTLLPAVLVVGVWVVWRGWAAWHSTRVADTVDTWRSLRELAEAVSGGRNLITEGALPGLKSVHLLFQGVALFDAGVLPFSISWVQLHHVFWTAIAALGIAWLARRWVGRSAAPVAAAAFLFSPFALFLPLNTSPFFVGPVMAAGLLVAATSLHRDRSPAALVALAPMAGIGLTLPPVAPIAALSLLIAFATLWRRRDLPAASVALALLLGLAALLPGLPGPSSFASMSQAYVDLAGGWAGMESMVLGQTSPLEASTLWETGRATWLDVPSGSLLAPFAIPRTPIRLWGDAWLDPVGAALAAVGLGLCVRGLRRDPFAVVLLAALAAGILPGFLSSFDRPSHTRMFVAPVPLALLSAVGFEALRRCLAGPTRSGIAAALACITIAAGGAFLFDVVNPRILARSWLALGIDALGTAPQPSGNPGALILDYPDPYESMPTDWLLVGPIASLVPDRPIPVRAYAGPQSLATSDVLLWSPALDRDEHVTHHLCKRRPEASLYTVVDRAGLSKALAAQPLGGTWEPRLPPEQWSVETCDRRATDRTEEPGPKR